MIKDHTGHRKDFKLSIIHRKSSFSPLQGICSLNSIQGISYKQLDKILTNFLQIYCTAGIALASIASRWDFTFENVRRNFVGPVRYLPLLISPGKRFHTVH